jgi:hypothetical protein
MTTILAIPLFFATLLSAFGGSFSPGEAFDVTAIRSIVIEGDASSIRITTDAAKPYEATTSGHRRGWFSSWYSSWFFNACKDESQVEVTGTVMTIRAAVSAWSDLGDCVPRVSANVPAGSAVQIEQQAFTARLDGNFGSLRTSGRAADITLNGHASAVDIAGAAVRANLSYASIGSNETVGISAQALEADLDFGGEVDVDYTVTAKASLVDAMRPSVPGARPQVKIQGDFVHARIR